MSFVENRDVITKRLIDLNRQVVNNEFTREDLRARGDEYIGAQMTVRDLIEGSEDLGQVKWEGDKLIFIRQSVNN